MRELKILSLVVAITAVLYWGIEPFAHSQMNPAVAPADFAFEDLEANNKVGDAAAGAETFMMAGCIACHGVESQGMDSPMDNETASLSFGVVSPDLGSAAYLYDRNFLAMLIKDPTRALKVEHKFNDENPHPMSAFYGLGGDIDQEVADIIAYLETIAPSKMSNKEVFEDACLRCHDMKYDKLYMPTQAEPLTEYMGTLPPDLSIIIRAKGHNYLNTFINNPQKHLEGTAMPRVGLKKDVQEQVISYLEEIGDSKKDERTKVGIYIIGFFIILSVFAYLWKRKIWKDL